MKTILLVEDNPDDEELTLKALKMAGLENDIVIARDGVLALDLLAGMVKGGSNTLPHLILLDLKLPRLDGLQVLERLRSSEETRLIPVVVLTTSAEEEDILTSYRLGANSYIRKPVAFDQFLETVRNLGLFWMKYNHSPLSAGAIHWPPENKVS